MKISRRGKLARRGKHTKRAGKHLRYKTKSKKFSGSKRYHRGNKRTHKRGKRFHRGGEKGCESLEFTDWTTNTISGSGNNEHTADGNPNIFLTYKKKGSLMSVPSDFSIEFKIRTNTVVRRYISDIVLKRQTSPHITCIITNNQLNSIIESIKNQNNEILVPAYINDNFSVAAIYGSYDFSFQSNLQCFEKVKKLLEDKISSLPPI